MGQGCVQGGSKCMGGRFGLWGSGYRGVGGFSWHGGSLTVGVRLSEGVQGSHCSAAPPADTLPAALCCAVLQPRTGSRSLTSNSWTLTASTSASQVSAGTACTARSVLGSTPSPATPPLEFWYCPVMHGGAPTHAPTHVHVCPHVLACPLIPGADNEYDATVKMPAAEFQRIVKDLSTIGDTGAPRGVGCVCV